jgi:hypothetical protein
MRHVVLGVLAIATAFWLAPFAHTLPARGRYAEIASIVVVFAVIDLVIGRAKKARKAASSSSGSSYAYSGTGKRR